MNCVIIEDEIPAQRILKNYIEKLSDLNLIGTFNSAIKANDILTNQGVDILFLDINLPDLSGMNYLNILKNPPSVIITTAYPDYAVESFEKEMIVDYLMKPFPFERFLKAVNKVSQKNMTSSSKSSASDHIFINIDKALHKVYLDNILYLESEHNYITVYTTEKKYTFIDTLKSWGQKLTYPNFIQIHKTYIVNLDKVDKLIGNTVNISQKTIPIGRTFKNNLIERLNI
ncbi:MAG: response regulator transcription factor [Flavobacteriaceae bacterium]|nr:response regulator transcription factor [Flavobacteriaceae bacterium]